MKVVAAPINKEPVDRPQTRPAQVPFPVRHQNVVELEYTPRC